MAKALVIRGANFSENALEQITFDIEHATAIVLSDSSVSLSAIGATKQLSYTLTPADAQDEVEWTSSDTDVCTVSDSGLVTVVGCGECTITATAGNVSDECAINVVIELTGYSKYRQAKIQASTSSNRFTSVDARLQTASGQAENMAMCVGAETTTNPICAYSLEKNDSGTYRIMTPEEIEAQSDSDKKRIYSIIGYPLPIALPSGCTKIRCIAKNALYAAYPLFFKRSARVSDSASTAGYSQAYRDISQTYDGYTFDFAESKDFNVPGGYDGVIVTWKADVSGGADAFRYMSDDDLALFKIVCL